MFRYLCSAMLLTVVVPAIMAQEPVTSFATVGRPERNNCIHRACARIEDKLDRCPCCGYGKTHNDLGVPGHKATKIFLFGSACEFFTEPCRTPPKGEGRWSKWSKMTNKGAASGCSNSGR